MAKCSHKHRKHHPINFHNYEDSASKTDSNKNLLTQCAVILQDLLCGFQKNARAFHEYARLCYYIIIETARFYFQKHSWLYIHVSVQKVLIQGQKLLEKQLDKCSRKHSSREIRA